MDMEAVTTSKWASGNSSQSMDMFRNSGLHAYASALLMAVGKLILGDVYTDNPGARMGCFRQGEAHGPGTASQVQGPHAPFEALRPRHFSCIKRFSHAEKRRPSFIVFPARKPFEFPSFVVHTVSLPAHSPGFPVVRPGDIDIIFTVFSLPAAFKTESCKTIESVIY